MSRLHDWRWEAEQYRDIDREAQAKAESAIDRIVRKNEAMWRMLDESLPHAERLAALEEAFGK